MIPISHLTLLRAHRMVVEIYSCGTVRKLREKIARGLKRLIPCDRASFNEFDYSSEIVVPTPVPEWWAQLGEVYRRHATDHPVVDPQRQPPLNRTVSFDDRVYFRDWNRSALNHEYFLPLGVKHQLGSVIYRRRHRMVALAVNRCSRPFSGSDRALFDLLNPHFSLAWRHALEVEALTRRSIGLDGPSPPSGTLLAIDAADGRIRVLSSAASDLLRRYFGSDGGNLGRLPDEAHRWLCAQIARVVGVDGGFPATLAPLIKQRASNCLTGRLVRHSIDEVLVWLEEERAPPPEPAVAPAGFTGREAEIAHWLIEGKRNSEISIILGVSPRTVEKHVEHVFMKLGVETRTAAVRQLLEAADQRHA